MHRLLCKTQTYNWGSNDNNCVVGHFANKHNVQQGPYAEFWMGTHHNGHSVIEVSGKNLSSVSGELPYLFKFLSVSKSLSIQLHPDEDLAKQLHKRNPMLYTDPFAKPEMAIAITETNILCGFRDDWMDILRQYKELPWKDSIKDLIEYLLTGYNVISVYKQILERVGFNPKNKTDELFVMLSEQHPNDTGALIAVFMNHITLTPGESISISPNVPHAYLSGDIVECMACSDNVIRVGLTNKPKDTNTLLGCVSYDTLPPLLSEPDENGTYISGFDEFNVTHVNLRLDEQKLFTCIDQSIMAVEKGSGYVEIEDYGYLVDAGMAFYIPAGVSFNICNITEKLSIWVASTPGSVSLS